MRKTIGLLLLLLLIGITCIGCAASFQADPPSEPLISSGDEGVEGLEPQGEEEGDAETASDADSAGGSAGGQEDDPGQGVQGSGDQSGGTANVNPPQPQPKESTDKAEEQLKCTFSISCSTVFDNLDKIDASKVEILPADGWIYPVTEVAFTEGESVFDILLRVTRQEKIHMESNSNPALKSKYVEGIHNLYEFDAGDLSGWTYKINGKGMGYGSSSSYPKDGDVIEWVYTCDQGRDVDVTP